VCMSGGARGWWLSTRAVETVACIGSFPRGRAATDGPECNAIRIGEFLYRCNTNQWVRDASDSPLPMHARVQSKDARPADHPARGTSPPFFPPPSPAAPPCARCRSAPGVPGQPPTWPWRLPRPGPACGCAACCLVFLFCYFVCLLRIRMGERGGQDVLHSRIAAHRRPALFLFVLVAAPRAASSPSSSVPAHLAPGSQPHG
jgi:hypothetical protein